MTATILEVKTYTYPSVQSWARAIASVGGVVLSCDNPVTRQVGAVTEGHAFFLPNHALQAPASEHYSFVQEHLLTPDLRNRTLLKLASGELQPPGLPSDLDEPPTEERLLLATYDLAPSLRDWVSQVASTQGLLLEWSDPLFSVCGFMEVETDKTYLIHLDTLKGSLEESCPSEVVEMLKTSEGRNALARKAQAGELDYWIKSGEVDRPRSALDVVKSAAASAVLSRFIDPLGALLTESGRNMAITEIVEEGLV